MTQLLLTLHQPSAFGRLEAGAVATVVLLADSAGQSAREPWRCERPVSIVGGAGTGVHPAVFDLPMGGVYEVKITRPRGEDLVHEFKIDEGERRVETVSLEPSPHESLGWHQYAGVTRANLPRRSAENRPPQTGSARFDMLVEQSQAQIDSLHGRVDDVPECFAAQVPAGRDAWSKVAEATRGHDRSWATAAHVSGRVPRWDAAYATWSLGAPEPRDGEELIRRLKISTSPEDSLSTTYPRWMAFRTAGRVDLASVPWSWWGAQKGADEQIMVVYDRARPSAADHAAPGRLTVSVLDHRWSGLLEFLASGTLSRTGTMFEQVFADEGSDMLFHPEAALFGKAKGPLVATAGAIVLMAQAKSTTEQPWDAWLENLSRWFPGIPDGAILLGCRRVDQARSKVDLRAAFTLLEEGVARGIPFFAATISMLSLALSQIAMRGADELRSYVAPVSTRVDPDQVFTVLGL